MQNQLKTWKPIFYVALMFGVGLPFSVFSYFYSCCCCYSSSYSLALAKQIVQSQSRTIRIRSLYDGGQSRRQPKPTDNKRKASMSICKKTSFFFCSKYIFGVKLPKATEYVASFPQTVFVADYSQRNTFVNCNGSLHFHKHTHALLFINVYKTHVWLFLLIVAQNKKHRILDSQMDYNRYSIH